MSEKVSKSKLVSYIAPFRWAKYMENLLVSLRLSENEEEKLAIRHEIEIHKKRSYGGYE